MYVQTLQAGIPTTTHLETYLAHNVPADARLDLQSTGSYLHSAIEKLPLPAALNPAHLCATEEPVLVYQRDGLTVPLHAYFKGSLAAAPVEPAAPQQPVAPAPKCSPAEQKAYDDELALYQTKLLPQYEAAKARYATDIAAYHALVHEWKTIETEVTKFNARLQAVSTAATYRTADPSSALQQIALDIQQLRNERLAPAQELTALRVINERLVKFGAAFQGAVSEVGIAYMLGVHEELKMTFAALLSRVDDVQTSDIAI
jgi:hypothetical protein